MVSIETHQVPNLGELLNSCVDRNQQCQMSALTSKLKCRSRGLYSPCQHKCSSACQASTQLVTACARPWHMQQDARLTWSELQCAWVFLQVKLQCIGNDCACVGQLAVLARTRIPFATLHASQDETGEDRGRGLGEAFQKASLGGAAHGPSSGSNTAAHEV